MLKGGWVAGTLEEKDSRKAERCVRKVPMMFVVGGRGSGEKPHKEIG